MAACAASRLKGSPVEITWGEGSAARCALSAVSADGSKFLSGPLLFETSTMLVLAQQNAANAPYVMPAGANFNVQTNQGGAVYAPDGSLLTAYNIVPVAVPAARANACPRAIAVSSTV